MSSRSKNRRKRRGRGPTGSLAPKVRVNVAIGDTDLAAASQFIKPAILYADHVTLYSPAASILESVRSIRQISDSGERFSLILEVIERTPALSAQLNWSSEALDLFKSVFSTDRQTLRHALRAGGADVSDIAAFERMFSEVDAITNQLDGLVDNTTASLGGGDLVRAIDTGVVTVEPLGSVKGQATVLDLADRPERANESWESDDFLRNFVEQLRGIVTDSKGFPLLDSQSTGLVRTDEAAGHVSPDPRTMLRGTEVGIASSSMGHLPSFPDLPMDEVLDLRKVLRDPLRRFRVHLANLSREIDSSPLGEDFQAELDELWRIQIEPSLRELRETLADNGLLRSTGSVVADDYQILLAEAGGVLHLGHGNTWDIVGTAAAALAAPMSHAVARGVRQYAAQRRTASRQSLYFLHRLDIEGNRRSR